MSRRIIILCEDTQQEIFIRQWLRSRNLADQICRVEKNPSGRGSGEQYVRQRYPIEVAANRREASYSTLGPALIVMIDADNKSIKERLDELDQALADRLQAKRGSTERITVMIPKRNIETWIYFVRQPPVDEETEYTKLPEPGACKQEVKNFIDTYRAEPSTTAPQSLKLAYEELKRIL